MVCSSLLLSSFLCLPPTCFGSVYFSDCTTMTSHLQPGIWAPFYQTFCYKPPKVFTSKPTCWLYFLCSSTPLEVQGLFIRGVGKDIRKRSLSQAHSVSLNRAFMLPRKLFIYTQIKKVEITGLLYSHKIWNAKKKEKLYNHSLMREKQSQTLQHKGISHCHTGEINAQAHREDLPPTSHQGLWGSQSIFQTFPFGRR